MPLSKAKTGLKKKTAVRDIGLQYYDSDFDPNKGMSVLHIYIPLER